MPAWAGMGNYGNIVENVQILQQIVIKSNLQNHNLRYLESVLIPGGATQ